MELISFILIFHLIIKSVFGLYDPSGSTPRILDAAMFKEFIKTDRQFALVEFYADWCGHCKAFAPEYEKVAKALSGIVKVYAVSDPAAGSEEGVQGYPTIKLYSGGKSITYTGPRSAEPLIDFVFEKAKGVAVKRMTKKPSSAKKEEPKKKDKKNEKQKNKKDKTATTDDDVDSEFKMDVDDLGPDVVKLTVQNFDTEVLHSQDPYFVLFYSKTCPKCQKLNPIWKTMSMNNKRFHKSGRVDADIEKSLVREYGITTFPAMLMFPQGRKQSPLTYDGQDEIFELKKWAMDNRGVPSKPTQLLSESVFRTQCVSDFCSILVVPNILDSSISERESLLNILEESIQDASTHHPVKTFWIEGGVSVDWEEDLRLQFGWPAVVVINLEKEKFWTHRGLFDKKSIQNFLKTSTLERPPFDSIPQKLSPLKTVEPWIPSRIENGKDKQEL